MRFAGIKQDWRNVIFFVFLLASFIIRAQDVWVDATLYREFNIVLPENSEPIVQEAVETFKKFWEQSTQKTVTISQTNEGKVNVWIGPQACALEFMQDTNFVDLGEEGFRILTYTPSKKYLDKGVAKHLAICANSGFGTIHGVYSFFEKVSGAKWLSEECVIMPMFRINIPHQDYSFTPSFKIRLIDSNLPRFSLTQELKHALHLSFGVTDKEAELINLDELCKGDEPLCLSTLETFENIRKEMENFILSNSERSVWIFRPPVEKKCNCDKCKVYETESGSPTFAYINLANKVLEEIGGKIPLEKKKVALSLDGEFLTPVKNIDLHKNLWIELDTRECDIAKPLGSPDSEINRKFSSSLKMWLKLTDNVWVRYRVGTNPNNPLFPLPDLVYLQKNVQWLDHQQVKGIIFDIRGKKNWIFSEWDLLKRYLYAKIMWEPDCLIEKELESFLSNYFGRSVGSVILEYFSLLDQYVGESEVSQKIDEERIWWDTNFAEEYLKIIKTALTTAKSNEVHYKRLLPFSLPAYYTSISLLVSDDDKKERLELLKNEVLHILEEIESADPSGDWEDYKLILTLR